jgi:RNA recognition motif-containing protein
MPKDRVTQMHQGYGFVEFMGEEDADYSIKIMNMIKLYGKPIRVNKVCVLFLVVFPPVGGAFGNDLGLPHLRQFYCL